MTEFLAFRGTRYNTSLVKLSNVVAPACSVLSPLEQKESYIPDPHNIIHLLLSHDSTQYENAADRFQSWLHDNILIRDREPCFYVYHQTFKAPNGQQYTRQSVVGRLRILPYGEGSVLPHEQTFEQFGDTRFQLLDTIKANLSPIFGLIEDRSFAFEHVLNSVITETPISSVTIQSLEEETVQHTLWQLKDAKILRQLSLFLESKSIIIADGHHRYETALHYSKKHPNDESCQYVMVALSNIYGEGMIALPTHRALSGAFDFNPCQFLDRMRDHFILQMFTNYEDALRAFEEDALAVTLLQLEKEARWVLVSAYESTSEHPLLARVPAWRLQEKILKPLLGMTECDIARNEYLFYSHKLEELNRFNENILKSKRPRVIFILKPISSMEMFEIVKSGNLLPPKSTYFYPKMLSGLVMHEFAIQN